VEVSTVEQTATVIVRVLVSVRVIVETDN